MRAHLRERVSSPCGDDGEVEAADHPPGGGGCAALIISSRCMEGGVAKKRTFFFQRDFMTVSAGNGQRDISRITTNNYQGNTVSAYWTWLQSIDQQATMRIPQTGVFCTLFLVMCLSSAI